MYRRTFLAGLAGSVAVAKPKRGMVLEAVFGARLPQTLRIAHWPAMTPRHSWYELRTYNSGLLHEPLANRYGIRPLLVERGASVTFLIPFDSLAQRNHAWTQFDADPEWQRLRSEGGPVTVSEITIYQPSKLWGRPPGLRGSSWTRSEAGQEAALYPGGRIFDRSL